MMSLMYSIKILLFLKLPLRNFNKIHMPRIVESRLIRNPTIFSHHWQFHDANYPGLAMIAYDMHSILAMMAESERVY